MYSRNDYRYYLEHRLEESDDYLAHYGVKGMKWRKHKSSFNPFNTPIAQQEKVKEHVATKNQQIGFVAEDANKAVGRSVRKQRSLPYVLKEKAQNKGKRVKKSLAPKHQKVEIITSPKRKRSKKEAAWNNEMKNYAKQVMSEGSHKRKKR